MKSEIQELQKEIQEIKIQMKLHERWIRRLSDAFIFWLSSVAVITLLFLLVF